MFATSDCTPSCGDGISMERGLVEWSVVPQGLKPQEFRSFSGTTEVVPSQRGVVGAAEVVRPKKVVNAKSRNSRSLTRKRRGFGMTMWFFSQRTLYRVVSWALANHFRSDLCKSDVLERTVRRFRRWGSVVWACRNFMVRAMTGNRSRPFTGRLNWE